jgi:hypothetical protein
MRAALFHPPSPSWVLHAQDADRLTPWLARFDLPPDAFAQRLGFQHANDLWHNSAQRPAGVALGPHSWSGEGTLAAILEPFQPWQDRLRAYAAWLEDRLAHGPLGLFINETAMLSMIAPTALSVDSRNDLLAQDSGFWWACCDDTTPSTPVFLPLSDREGMEAAMRQAPFAVCWTATEQRVLAKRLPAWTGHLVALAQHPTQTPWAMMEDRHHQGNPDCLLEGLHTLAQLALEKSARLPKDTVGS